MNFSTLFRLEENLQLDKKTLVALRYIAIFGQLFAINVVHNYLNLTFPIIESHIIIFIGLISNLYLQVKIKSSQLKEEIPLFLWKEYRYDNEYEVDL